MTVNAVDATGLSPTDITNLAKNGVKTVGRYLSHSSWKALSLGEVANLKAAGMQIFSIYESNPTHASYFTADKGKADALDAIALAKALGQPENTAIYFTVDYDAQSSDLANILAYFKAVKANLSGYKVGAYGSFTTLNYLHENGAADYWFQTCAWSNGQRCAFNNIYQFQCDKTIGGVSVDFNNLETADIGAWNQPKPATQQPSKPATPVITSGQIPFNGTATIVENTVVRTGPNPSFDIVESVAKGGVYNVYGYKDGWYNVGNGWISAKEATFLMK